MGGGVGRGGSGRDRFPGPSVASREPEEGTAEDALLWLGSPRAVLKLKDKEGKGTSQSDAASPASDRVFTGTTVQHPEQVSHQNLVKGNGGISPPPAGVKQEQQGPCAQEALVAFAALMGIGWRTFQRVSLLEAIKVRQDRHE